MRNRAFDFCDLITPPSKPGSAGQLYMRDCEGSPGCGAATLPCHAARLEIQAAAIREAVMSTEKRAGTGKKYLKLRIVTATKQIENPQVTTGIRIRRSRDIPPSCQLRTAANTRKTVTKRPNPTQKRQYARRFPWTVKCTDCMRTTT